MTTRACCPVTMRRVAVIPSSTGILMSISTMSGCSSLDSRTACWPSPAWPTTDSPGWLSSSVARPARTRAWSSAMTTLISAVAGHARAAPAGASGMLARTANPPPGSAPAVSCPP